MNAQAVSRTACPDKCREPEDSPQQWRLALQDSAAPLPSGLVSANGSSVAQRFSIHRNNVLSACIQALVDTFPVTQAWVGEAFFNAMALTFAQQQVPRNRRMAFYGLGFADFVRNFAPAQSQPYLSELACLEMARVQAYHAVDANSVATPLLQALVHDPERLSAMRFALHPSLSLIRSDWAVISLWQAHQRAPAARDAMLENLDLRNAECAAVFRRDDRVFCMPLSLPEGLLLRGLQAGQCLGEAIAQAPVVVDMARALALLIEHQLITNLIEPSHGS